MTKTQKAQKRPTISARKLARLREERAQNMQRRAERLRKGKFHCYSYYGLKTYLKGTRCVSSPGTEIKNRADDC